MSETNKKRRPATSPEAQEKRMVSLAMDLAEKQLRKGTASSQVITQFLKIGSTQARIEKEILLKQKDLISAKTDAIKSQKQTEELYKSALKAMSSYQGNVVDDENDD